MNFEIVDSLSGVPAAHWNALTDGDNPFLKHAFLYGLEHTGCVGDGTGWVPQYVLAYRDKSRADLVGGVPLYLKSHSYGEYVFDWAWANAYHRAGLDYYPKLLVAVPFTPVTGPRVLAARAASHRKQIAQALIDYVRQYAETLNVSSLHWLFTDDENTCALRDMGFLVRIGSQFHWQNHNFSDFDGFLDSFNAKNRKKIKRERRRVREAEISMEVLAGTELTPYHWDVMYEFYRSTVSNHGAHMYLNRAFFSWLAESMSDQTVMIMARHNDRHVAGGLYLQGGNTLYGRYWGAVHAYDGLHFETCYYSAIEYCIEQRLKSFEAGAQGEHKLTRGLLPTTTYSAHWLSNPQFSDAIADFLDREAFGMQKYTRDLHTHSPYRQEH